MQFSYSITYKTFCFREQKKQIKMGSMASIGNRDLNYLFRVKEKNSIINMSLILS